MNPFWKKYLIMMAGMSGLLIVSLVLVGLIIPGHSVEFQIGILSGYISGLCVVFVQKAMNLES